MTWRATSGRPYPRRRRPTPTPAGLGGGLGGGLSGGLGGGCGGGLGGGGDGGGGGGDGGGYVSTPAHVVPLTGAHRLWSDLTPLPHTVHCAPLPYLPPGCLHVANPVLGTHSTSR